jgi:hypothetical protein
VTRGEHTPDADEARVRIWASRAPKYDSGWTAVQQVSSAVFEHNVGGNPDTYVLDLQFKDADGGLGVNQRGYGQDRDYDLGAGAPRVSGAYWYGLTNSSVEVARAVNDVAADGVRVRLWIAPEPAFDSRWRAISKGETLTITHRLNQLGYQPDDFVVDLQFKQVGGVGVNQQSYGGDTYFEYGSIQTYAGAYWRALDNRSVVVQRMPDDTAADQVRVRIWPNTRFDFQTSWMLTGAGTVAWQTFSLGACPGDPVVDLQFKDSDGPADDVNNLYYGGNLLDVGIQLEFGAWLRGLTRSLVSVHRGANDLNVERARARIWSTRGCSVYVPVVMRGAG